MWAANGKGEGVNLAYEFAKHKKYCMETTVRYLKFGDDADASLAKSNIYLTEEKV